MKWVPVFWRIFIFTVFSWSVASEAISKPIVLGEPGIVLPGVLTSKKFTNANGGMEAWTNTILILDSPIDVFTPAKKHHGTSAPTSNAPLNKITGIKEMQVSLPSGVDEKALLGKRILVSGTLRSSETVHDHTQVLMEIKGIKFFKPKPTAKTQ